MAARIPVTEPPARSIFDHEAYWQDDLQPYCPQCLYGNGTIVELERSPENPESGVCPICGRRYPRALGPSPEAVLARTLA
jgi:hypothetical protein